MYRHIYKFLIAKLSMKIREVLDKKVGTKEYTRYIVILPKDIVAESKLLGKELKAKLERDKIIIEKESD